MPFRLVRRVCTIVENTEAKIKYLENLKMNLTTFQYQKQLFESGIKKALSISLQELHTPKTLSSNNSLPLIAIYNPNNTNFYETIENQ